MAMVVLDSKDLVKSLETGEIPVPTEVALDRAGPKAKEKPVEPTDDKAGAGKAAAEPEDEEDDNGLTAAQRKEFSDKMQRTISRKHRQLKEAEEFAAAQYNERRLAEERATTAERALAELKGKEPAAKVEPKVAPKREDFKSDDEFEEAKFNYRYEERQASERQAAAKKADDDAQAQIVSSARAQIAKAIEVMPDYEERTHSDTPVPAHIGQFMMNSDKFAELGLHFADHPDELLNLSKMPARNYAEVMRVGIALDKIASKLQPFAKTTPAKSEAEVETESAAGSAGPSTKTESVVSHADPSKPRETAPVIRPLSSASGSQVEKTSSQRSTREEIVAWQRSSGANLQVRKRH